MRTFLVAILGALIGGVYEAFLTIEMMRTGAYSPAWGFGIILAGAAVGAVVFAAADAAHRMYMLHRR